MSQEIIIALIQTFSGLTLSIITGISGYWLATRQTKESLSDLILQKRLEVYPKLIALTQKAGKESDFLDGQKFKLEAEQKIKNTREILASLIDWQINSGGFLLLSSRKNKFLFFSFGEERGSLKYFYELKEVLSKNPGNGKDYTREQMKNMFYARNRLRGALREDIGILHTRELEK